MAEITGTTRNPTGPPGHRSDRLAEILEAYRQLGYAPRRGAARRAVLRAMYEEQGGLCALCGKPMPRLKRSKKARQSADQPTLDHITPLGAGGREHISNLQVAHSACNGKKGCRVVGKDGVALTESEHRARILQRRANGVG